MLGVEQWDQGFSVLGPCPCFNTNLRDKFSESFSHLYFVHGHREQPLSFEDLGLVFIIFELSVMTYAFLLKFRSI